MRCPGLAGSSSAKGCSGTVTLALLHPGDGAQALGRGRFALRSVARRTVRVALSAGERRLLASTPRPLIGVRVAVAVATRGDPGGPEIVTRYVRSWRVRLAAG
jgi:hypothetical protein